MSEIIEGTCKEISEAEIKQKLVAPMALAPVEREPAALERVKPLSPEQMLAAMETYRRVQTAIDKMMPDMLMEVQGRMFRKKGYWRAVRVAFNLSLELVEERLEHVGDDWGYLVTYRSTDTNGVSSIGDGSCFASEKCDKYGKPTKMQTVHNVRSHAHTRAQNRAISNLVGFGEVSAEELTKEDLEPAHNPSKPVQMSMPAKVAHPAVQAAKDILGAQEDTSEWALQLWAHWKREGMPADDFKPLQIKAAVQDMRHASEMEMARMNELVFGYITESKTGGDSK